jgi:hypothetical protein
MKLCFYNDCRAGEYRLSLCCTECDIVGCPERCERKDCVSCFWMKEAEDYDKDQTGAVNKE